MLKNVGPQSKEDKERARNAYDAIAALRGGARAVPPRLRDAYYNILASWSGKSGGQNNARDVFRQLESAALWDTRRSERDARAPERADVSSLCAWWCRRCSRRVKF